MRSVHSFVVLLLPLIGTFSGVLARELKQDNGEILDTVTFTSTATKTYCPCDDSSVPTWAKWDSASSTGSGISGSQTTYDRSSSTVVSTSSAYTTSFHPSFSSTTGTISTTSFPFTTSSRTSTRDYDFVCSGISSKPANELSSASSYCSSLITPTTSTITGKPFSRSLVSC